MNEINPIRNKNQQIKLKGKIEMPTFDEQLVNLVKNLKDRDREVPEYGDFKIVSEKVDNFDSDINATHFVLEISKPSKNVYGHEKIRDLKAIAYNLPHPFKSEILLATGSKDDIFKALSDKDLLKKLPEIYQKLAHDLEDI